MDEGSWGVEEWIVNFIFFYIVIILLKYLHFGLNEVATVMHSVCYYISFWRFLLQRISFLNWFVFWQICFSIKLLVFSLHQIMLPTLYITQNEKKQHKAVVWETSRVFLLRLSWQKMFSFQCKSMFHLTCLLLQVYEPNIFNRCQI